MSKKKGNGMSTGKMFLVLLVATVGLCIGVWAIGKTAQMQGDHSQGISNALKNAGIPPATSTSPAR